METESAKVPKASNTMANKKKREELEFELELN